MKNKSVFIGVLVVLVVGAIVAFTMILGKDRSPNKAQSNSVNSNTVSSSNTVSGSNSISQNKTTENKIQEKAKSEQKGTAGSNIPLKDNEEEARRQIEIAMKNWIKETYGNEVVDSKINVTKIYTATEEQQIGELKERNLGLNEVAFEVSYELKIAEGVQDTTKFTAATGVFNEQTRWVTEKTNLGILRQDGTGYKITDFGTGW